MIKIKNRLAYVPDYVCEITEILDDNCNKYINQNNGIAHHLYYLGNDDLKLTKHVFAVRGPGYTIGELVTNRFGIIEKISIGDDYINDYNSAILNKLGKYINKRIELPKE